MFDEEFIAIIKSSYGAEVQIQLFRSNGEYLCTKVHKIDSQYGYGGYSGAVLSPNGKYLFYKCDHKHEEGDPETVESAKEQNDNDNYYAYAYGQNQKQDIHVYEITLVRRKSVANKISTQIQKMLESDEIKKKEKLKTKILAKEVRIELKLVRKIKNSHKLYKSYYSPTISDIGTLTLIDIYDNKVFYEDQDLSKFLEKKLGKDDDGNYYKPVDYLMAPLKSGIIAYRSEQLYHIKMKVAIKEENNKIKVDAKPHEVVELDLYLGEVGLEIRSIYECNNHELIIIVLSNDLQQNLFVVWSLIEN